MKKIILSVIDAEALIQKLHREIQVWRHRTEISEDTDLFVYGIPRGGVPVALALVEKSSKYVLIDKPDLADVIVDDIICSGKTIQRVKDQCQKDTFFSGALLGKPDDGSWYVFPWEKNEEGDDSSADDIVIRALERIGENPNRDGLKDTPKRVLKAWDEIYKGYDMDPKEILSKTFDNEEGYNEMVILRDVEFFSTCEHHMMPFFGRAHIAYIPSDAESGKVVGLSKLARLVECFSRRLQIQERLTEQIADSLEKELRPKGVAVILEARHLCMTARGVNKQNSIMVTSAIRGSFEKDESRMEFLMLNNRRPL